MMNSQSVQQPAQPPVGPSAVGGMPLPSVWNKAWEVFFARRLVIYICALLAASIGAYGYGLRTHGVFACPADGYGADRYVAYCNVGNFADYEHGAFQFNLEPSVQTAVRNADVLFLGNSRLQVALSTAPTEQWFSANSDRYYLMGFSYFENAFFEGELLRKIQPHAKVYIINADDFFEQSETEPVSAILHDPRARNEYEGKRFWQRVQQRVCGAVAALCGHQFVIFRSRATGAYYREGQLGGHATPVSYDPVVDQNLASTNIAIAREFLSRFTRDKCVILTIVPTVDTKIGTAKAIASALGLPLVTPEVVEGLQTVDGSHLDQPSARRWSQAFFQAAGPEIRSCLENRSAAVRQGASPMDPVTPVRSATTAVR